MAESSLAPGYPESLMQFDPREVAMLPQYCIYTQYFRDKVPGGNNQDEMKRWYATMGDVFHTMHHYCFGMMFTTRAMALSRDDAARRTNLKSSIPEYDYVIDRAPADFYLLPEILTRKGTNLFRLGQNAFAVESLERAIELKPDYWAPYAYLSDHYKEVGDRKKARETLQAGLKYSPDAVGLKRRAAELESTGAKTAPPQERSQR